MTARARTIPIARGLLVAMTGLVFTVSAITVAVTHWRTRAVVDNLMLPIAEGAEDKAEGALHQLFDPITQRLLRDHGLVTRGRVKRYDPSALVAEFLPAIEQLPQCGSMMISDVTGYQFLLMRYDALALRSPLLADRVASLPAPAPGQLQFFTRDLRPATWAERSVWTLWAPDGRTQMMSWDQQLPGYDPKLRPWFVNAVAAHVDRSPAELRAHARDAIAWSDVYPLFTTKTAGISASLAAKDPSGELVIVAYDVLLDDISAFTQRQRPTLGGRIVVFTEDGRVVGLPADARYDDPAARAAALLGPVEGLGIADLNQAVEAFRAQAPERRLLVTRLESESGSLWVSFRRFPLGDRSFWIGVTVPEADLLRRTARVETIIVVLGLAGLLAAIMLARLWAGRFARPLSALAARSEQIAALDLAPATPVRSRLREVTQLSGALESMRASLAEHIDEREVAARELGASERRFRLIVENASDMIVLVDLEARFIDVNRTACEMLGYTREELLRLGVPDIDAEWPLERLRQPLDDLVPLVPDTVVSTLKRKDGSTFPAEIHNAKVTGLDGRPCVVAMIRNVGERVELEERTRQAQKMEALGRLAGGIAHDFNNLLTVIMGFTGTLQQTHANDPETCADLEVIAQTSERAAAMTQQLLAFSRRKVNVPTSVDVKGALAEVRSMLGPLLGETVEVEVIQEDVPPVQIDPGQLQQLLVNLCINARDAMPDGGRLRIEARLADRDAERTGDGERAVELLVSDEGVGIPPDVRDRLFEPFFTTKSIGHGTGLGLATCKSIVESAGGRISFEGRATGGTTFRVSLKVAVEARDATKPATTAAPRDVDGTETILVVEDDDAVRRVTVRALERKGYRLLVARDGPEAIALAANHGGPIDLLLTDVVMPKMSGADIALRVKETHPGTAIVFVSGYADHPAVQELVLQGATFLAKPFTAEALRRSIRATLDDRARAPRGGATTA